MLSSFLYAMLKLSKKSSLQKLFGYDFITLYNKHRKYIYLKERKREIETYIILTYEK